MPQSNLTPDDASPNPPSACEVRSNATGERPVVIRLDYAAPVGLIDPWQGWPLASGAAYAVVTGVWAFIWFFLGIDFDPLPWQRVPLAVALMIWAPVHTLAAVPLLRRARKYGRPIWLEVICLVISICCLLGVITRVV